MENYVHHIEYLGGRKILYNSVGVMQEIRMQGNNVQCIIVCILVLIKVSCSNNAVNFREGSALIC